MKLLKACADALQRWGAESQIHMLFEEMAELQKEICRALRGADRVTVADAIAEEIADVEIVLLQMKILFDVFTEVEEWKKAKARRLAERLAAEEAKAQG